MLENSNRSVGHLLGVYINHSSIEKETQQVSAVFTMTWYHVHSLECIYMTRCQILMMSRKRGRCVWTITYVPHKKYWNYCTESNFDRRVQVSYCWGQNYDGNVTSKYVRRVRELLLLQGLQAANRHPACLCRMPGVFVGPPWRLLL